jgi:hypothetical protein
MLFMNKKEEVLDIELTPYGKHLLSNGKLKPVYYAFFDDNILYDIQYGGETENQSAADTRIRNITPQLQTQSKFTEDFKESIEVDFGGGDKVVTTAPLEKDALSKPIGTSQMGVDKYAATNMRLLKGTANSYDLEYRTKFGKTIIPQININVDFKVTVSNITSPETSLRPMDDSSDIIAQTELTDGNITSEIAPDGTFLSIQTDFILADILEENTDFMIENFEVEVFEVVTPVGLEEQLIPLSFAKKTRKSIVNNILLDEIPEEDMEEVTLNPSNVEYYFDIFYDGDIDRELISNSVSVLKSKGLYTDQDYLSETSLFIREAISDIYGTNVSIDDIEDCI